MDVERRNGAAHALSDTSNTRVGIYLYDILMIQKTSPDGYICTCVTISNLIQNGRKLYYLYYTHDRNSFLFIVGVLRSHKIFH